MTVQASQLKTLTRPAAVQAEARSIRYLVQVSVILLAGFALRVWDLGGPSLWADEVMTEYRVQAPLAESLENILKTIDQTPFFFMLLRLFPSDNELLLRLPAALLGVLGTALLIRVTRRLYHDDALALWAGAWLAFNPYHVWLSRTARAYSLIFILALLVSYLFLRLWRGPALRRIWIAFAGVSLVAYITHYSLLGLPFTQMILIGLYWRQRQPFARRWALAQTVAALPVLGWAVAMVLNMTPREPQWGERPWLHDLVLTLRNLTVGYDGPLDWYTVPGLIVAVGGLLLALATWRGQPPAVAQMNLYWALLITMPLLLVFGVSLVAINAYIDRYFMALFPALIILVAFGWQRAGVTLGRWPRAPRLALLGVIFTGACTVGYSFYNDEMQREDWRSAARYVRGSYDPSDIFVVDRAVTMTAFQRYFNATDPLRVIQLSETDAEIPADEPGARYWLIFRAPDEDIHRVTHLPEFDPFVAHPTPTSRWLMQRQQHVIACREFDGVTMLLLHMDDARAGAAPAGAAPVNMARQDALCAQLPGRAR